MERNSSRGFIDCCATLRSTTYGNVRRRTGAIPNAKRQICACFERMLPQMKPLQAELLRRVELNDEQVAHSAAALGITPNLASVTLSRARVDLRAKLVDFCGNCSCLSDCVCAPEVDHVSIRPSTT
jgi:hypothetical protein